MYIYDYICRKNGKSIGSESSSSFGVFYKKSVPMTAPNRIDPSHPTGVLPAELQTLCFPRDCMPRPPPVAAKSGARQSTDAML